ncbi:FAD binding domain-containing protein [Georgenia yuyongxinii]|uniref:Xanthine dehydrogenase family protein subunit M n=1 Tax=Georgenia yuyongxinii TaxID=2589797 RepID=A0A552WUY3_9MICO|nr:xanthine dehydrogenase family protein subunit M [Georgenia yuyongxinii]TRW46584.1 xanthine dehydrogenase family protein subunit M [Georgenia yuyongxinii]
MILPPFRYLRPHSVSHATDLLREVPGAAVLAGGQTLINALKLDLVSPTALVDVHALEELRGVERTADGVRIGAATTYAELAKDPVVREVVPSVAEMAAGLVDRQVRNRGTIGGNVSLNDPTNNFPPLLSALGASFEVITADGADTLTAEQFFRGALATAVTGGGLLTAVHVPALPTGTRLVHRHMQLARDSWALARVVVRAAVDGASLTEPRVYLGTVPGSPVRLTAVEAAIAGRPLAKETITAALAAFDTEPFETISDTHGSAQYRRAMAKVQLRRALVDVIEKEQA